MNSKNYFKRWLAATAIRALKTAAETALSMLTIGQLFIDVNWAAVLSVSGVAAVIAVLTCIKGLPEVEV